MTRFNERLGVSVFSEKSARVYLYACVLLQADGNGVVYSPIYDDVATHCGHFPAAAKKHSSHLSSLSFLYIRRKSRAPMLRKRTTTVVSDSIIFLRPAAPFPKTNVIPRSRLVTVGCTNTRTYIYVYIWENVPGDSSITSWSIHSVGNAYNIISAL